MRVLIVLTLVSHETLPYDYDDAGYQRLTTLKTH